jgi:hypothetical protein
MFSQRADLLLQLFNYLLFLVHLFKLLYFFFAELNFKKHGDWIKKVFDLFEK